MGKSKVLIVDDEIDFLKITKSNLQKAGNYDVETISEAADIISRVRIFKPDVILLDIRMPRIDGVDTCRMLNDDPQGKETPIITLSALDNEKDKRMMYKLGVVDFLAKPVGIEELVAKIEKALQNKTSRT